jgi:hypothetical protein
MGVSRSDERADAWNKFKLMVPWAIKLREQEFREDDRAIVSNRMS